MTRRLLAVAALTLSAVAAVVGCQDYNFNPVGACLIQPGSRQVKLAAVTSADVLFVVDDSGSMDTKQQALADNYSSFIDALAAAQKARVSRGLQAFEFHLAVTTSSVFRDYQLGPEPGFFTRFESQLTPGCTQGLAVAGGAYPQGDFVAYGTNAKVLHFTKDLNWASWGTASPDPAITALVKQFVGTKDAATGKWSGGNVEVGSCGSGEEQHLQGGRLAMQKAIGGQQTGVQAGEFAHQGAKLVLVFVGDEDDCSNDPANPLLLTGNPGNDSCVQDKFLPAGQQKLWAATDFANAFAALVAPSGQTPTATRPYESLGAAFIVSAVRCADGSYAPADSCQLRTGETPVGTNVCPHVPPATCNPPTPVGSTAYAAGVRFFQLADEIKGRGFDVVEGSVCQGSPCEDFGPILSAIADLVKAPTALRLPSLPAASDLVVVRILDSGGAERKVCTRAKSDAERPTSGWWFMDCNDRQDPPAWVGTPTSCIFLNQAAAVPANNCLANPGETYSAEYLGLLPQPDPLDPVDHPGGCANPSDATNPPPSQECADAMEGKGADARKWACVPVGSAGRGTCVCNRSGP